MGCELASNEPPPGYELGTFAGGCFWGLELKFQRVPGVVKTSVGYANGSAENPTYEQVCSGRTGHTEAVQVCMLLSKARLTCCRVPPLATRNRESLVIACSADSEPVAMGA